MYSYFTNVCKSKLRRLNLMLKKRSETQPFGIIKIDGEMAERSKAHAWRACGGQKPPVGSNPTLSANPA